MRRRLGTRGFPARPSALLDSNARDVPPRKANPKPIVPVPGLGTPAYFVANFILLTWKKGTEITFSVSGTSGSPLAQEKALAKKVLSRI